MRQFFASKKKPASAKLDLGDYCDTDWYALKYPDAPASKDGIVQHYLAKGFDEGRQPNAFFDPEWYREIHADVAAAGLNPLQHYVQSGWKEGRDPGPAFSAWAYLLAYPDVRAVGEEPLRHFLLYGRFEGRRAFSQAQISDALKLSEGAGVDQKINYVPSTEILARVKAALTRASSTFSDRVRS